ncbi:MAG: hypothetical protein LBT22_08735 [Peptococcaceae bacterium]|jgi:hypothetical protein|nr:hypothetical protein [Peptococcaceae bacterium]
MNLNKTSAALIAVILAAVASLAFLVVEVTALFVTAYIFTLFAIAVMLCGNLSLLNNPRTYPWGAALPQSTFTCLVVSFVVSLLAVVLEQAAKMAVPVKWFVIAQAIIFAVFAIRLIMLNAGRTEIERVGDNVKATTFDWKMLLTDLEALAAKSPDVKPLLEAIKCSDPLTSPALAEYDNKIRDGVAALELAVNTGGGVDDLIAALLRQLKDRNNRAKLLK